MPDRRVVDDLTIEELEQVLRIRKRQARLERLRSMEQKGRKQLGVSPMEEHLTQDLEETDPAASLSYESFLFEDRTKGWRWRDRSLRDKLLFMVEMGAVAGLVAILGYAAYALQDINREASEAQAEELVDLPTPTTTPIVSVAVLPGGHTFSADMQLAMPNYDEVPQHLRPLLEQSFSGPVVEPTPSSSSAIRIQIPAIEVDAPIVQGDGWEQLKKGVGQHIGTANPGENGNMVLSAHNDIYGEHFRKLDQLVEGDEITIFTMSGTYTYRVLYWQRVDPSAVEVMAPSPEPIVTLISCYPYLINNERIVVIAELVK